MYVCLPLALVIFAVATSCVGFPTEKSGIELPANDSPKDEYDDVIRLLNSSAAADSEEGAKAHHAARASPHVGAQTAHMHPIASIVESKAASKTHKKSSKKSPVKKYKTRKNVKKHISKKEKKIDGEELPVNDSPYDTRGHEVLSRRRISRKLQTPEVQSLALPHSLPSQFPQTEYQTSNFQPNYYNYQSSYPRYYNDYSFPSYNPYMSPQSPFYPESNNWADNSIQIDQVPSEPIITMPPIEPPKFTWTAEIEYPNMPPIVITDKNYTDNPNVDVLIHSPIELPAEPAVVQEPKIKKTRSVPSYYNSPPPVIWSHGIPYVPLRQPQYSGPSHFLPQYNNNNPMMTSYDLIRNPYNMITPPVYYNPPSPLPYTQSTPIQTWQPSSQQLYPTWPSGHAQHYNHPQNTAPLSVPVGRGLAHATVFQGSKEVTGDNVEVNVFPVDANAADVDDSDELKPVVLASDGDDDNVDEE